MHPGCYCFQDRGSYKTARLLSPGRFHTHFYGFLLLPRELYLLRKEVTPRWLGSCHMNYAKPPSDAALLASSEWSLLKSWIRWCQVCSGVGVWAWSEPKRTTLWCGRYVVQPLPHALPLPPVRLSSSFPSRSKSEHSPQLQFQKHTCSQEHLCSCEFVHLPHKGWVISTLCLCLSSFQSFSCHVPPLCAGLDECPEAGREQVRQWHLTSPEAPEPSILRSLEVTFRVRLWGPFWCRRWQLVPSVQGLQVGPLLSQSFSVCLSYFHSKFPAHRPPQRMKNSHTMKITDQENVAGHSR